MNTLVRASSTITVIEINNPFDPKDSSRTERTIQSETLLDLMPNQFQEYVVCVNGILIEKDDLEECILKDGDWVIFSPIPQGSGGGKGILRMVALIALTYVTFGAGAPAMFAKAGFQGYLAAGLTFAAGAAVINNLLPVQTNLPQISSDLSNSQTYGIDGPKNTSAEGIPVPVVYGRYRVAGNIINLYVNNISGETQDVYMQFALSEGPIGAISESEIRINDQPISNFKDYEVDMRTGYSTQTPSSWFYNTISPQSVSKTITTNFTTYTTSTAIDKFRVDVVAPSGFRKIKADGGSEAIKEDIIVEYKKTSEPDNAYVSMVATYSKENALYVRAYYYNDNNGVSQPTLNAGDTELPDGAIRRSIYVHDEDHPAMGTTTHSIVGYWVDEPTYVAAPTISGKYSSTFRMSFTSPELTSDFYDIRVKRVNPESTDPTIINQLIWSDLNEIQIEPIQYNYTAWLGVKIRLSDQLNSIPNITTQIDGIFCKTYELNTTTGQLGLHYRSTSNPAWVAYDMMTKTRYGAGIPESQIDLNKWVSWAYYCYSNGLEYNGVFDTEMNVWDALQYVFRAGHAQIINLGTRFSVAMEAPDTPVALFSVANIIKETFQMNWIPTTDRANQIEATYYDRDDYFKQKTVKVTDGSIPGSAQKRKTEITLYGVTSADQAVKEAQLLLNMNKYILLSVTFEATIEAISCVVGDVIYVQHDIPQWGYAGRFAQDSTDAQTGFVLDKEVTIDAGKTYELLIQHDSVLVGSFTVDSIVSNRYVRLTPASMPTTTLKRAIIDGVDYKIVNTFVDSFGEGIVTDVDVPASAVGKACDLYDTDVIESRQLTSATVGGAGQYTTISTDTPFSDTGKKYSKWMFGEAGINKKPFRVINISGGTETTRQITATEYNESVYTDPVSVIPAPNYSSLPTFIGQPTNLTLYQEAKVIGSVYQPVIVISWDAPNDDAYRGAIISMREKNGQWEVIQTVEGGTTEYSYRDGIVGQVLDFRVQARDALGKTSPASTAPIKQITVTAVGVALDAPTNIAIKGGKSSVKLTWTNPTANNYVKTEIYRSATNDNMTAVKIHETNGESFSDREIIIGTQYYYWFKTVNSDGVASGFNATAGTTLSAPVSPTGLALVKDFIGDTAEIKWDDLTDANNYQVDVTLNSLIRRSTTTIANQYHYGLEEMKQDGYTDRNIMFEVSAINVMGLVSVPSVLNVTNTAPSLPTNMSVETGFKVARITFNLPKDPDYKFLRVWMGTTTGFTANSASLIAESFGSPVTIEGLSDNTPYYFRFAAVDTFGEGPTSSEWNITTQDLSSISGLSPWASVTTADKAFITANLADNSIPSTKIEKIVASKIVTGTLAATESISVDGTIEAISGGYNVTLGPKTIGSDVALFSFMQGTTPIVAMYENGNANFNGSITITGSSTGFSNLDAPANVKALSGTEKINNQQLLDANAGPVNLLPDYAMSDSDYWWSHYGHNIDDTFITITDGKVSNTVCHNATHNNFWNYSTQKVPVIAGKKYIHSAWMRKSATPPSGGSNYLVYNKYDINKVSKGYNYHRLAAGDIGTDWTFVSYVIDCDALLGGATSIHYISPGFAINHSGTLAGCVECQGVRLVEQVGADVGYTGALDATKGATWGSDISGQPSDSELLNNLLDQSAWEVGTTGDTGQFIQDGPDTDNSRTLGVGPYGTTETLWTIAPTTYPYSAVLGFTTTPIPIDSDKTYRASVWVKSNNITSFGLPNVAVHDSLNDSIKDFLGGQARSVPSGILPEANKWYLAVILIYSKNNTVNTIQNISGLYDPVTGANIAAVGENRFGASTTDLKLQAGVINVDDTNYRMWLARPRIDVVNGAEPSIPALLAGDQAGAILNSQQQYNDIQGTKPPPDADKTSKNKAAGLDSPDVRNDNQPPSFYYAKGKGIYSEFKFASVIGVPSADTYVSLKITVPWVDTTGGVVVQQAYGATDSYKRVSTGNTTWGAWTKVEDNATKGATWGSDISGQPSDAQINNNYTENNVTTIPRPLGGSYANENSDVYGAFVIELPQGWSDTMMRMHVDVYNYVDDTSFTLAVGGYTYGVGAKWLNTFAQITGNIAGDNQVRFGINTVSGNCVIVIGNTSSHWRYPKLTVRDFQAGYATYDIASWESGWNVSLQSSLTNYNLTIDYPDALLDAKGIVGQGALAKQSTVDWATQIPDRPSDDVLLNNLLDATTWEDGQSGSVTNFTVAGASANSTRVVSDGPYGFDEVIWRGTSQGENGANSGWGSSVRIPININKAYRFSVWVRRLDDISSGSVYFGTLGNTVINVVTGVLDGNPYFWNGDLPELNKWFLIVGIIYPANTTRTTKSLKSGLYDPDTGLRLNDGTNREYKFDTAATETIHRAMQYYDTVTGSRQDFARPRIDVLNGNEPSIADLLVGGQTSGLLNTQQDYNDVQNIPDRFTDTPTNGLNLTSTHLGYYNNGWKSYIHNTGSFHFGDASTNYIDFDGTNLVIDTPNLVVDGTGNVSVTGTVTGSTITGSSFKTAATGVRTEILSSDNQFHSWWDSGGGGLLEENITIGNAGDGNNFWAIKIGGTNYNDGGIRIDRQNNNSTAAIDVRNGVSTFSAPSINGATAIFATASGGHGVYAYTSDITKSGVYAACANSGTAIYGTSQTGIGVVGEIPYTIVTNPVAIGVLGRSLPGTGKGKGVQGEGNQFDFYAAGNGVNYGSFTGAHDGLVSKSAPMPALGDIVCVESIVAKQNVSNTICSLVSSSASEQKNIFGVMALESSLNEISTESDIDVSALRGLTKAEYDDVYNNYDLIAFNALGEGQINVCSEGGDIEVGDFICTSTVQGKGKRYDGNNMRVVVARALEPVVWANETDTVKMIGCVYLCG